MFRNKFNRLIRRHPTIFFVTQLRHTTITTRVENDSEKKSIDLFVITRYFFRDPCCGTTMTTRVESDPNKINRLLVVTQHFFRDATVAHDDRTAR
jgi:hypothetical protein